MSKERWKLTDEEYEFIKGEVAHVLLRYQIRCVPVNGFEIAREMGILLIPYSSLSQKALAKAEEASEDGFVVEENDGREYIYYNDIGKSKERQNWTVLHEIGHIVLDHSGINPEREEDEANFFAKFAIAPPVYVYRVGVESSEELHRVFDVSNEEAIYAYEYYLTWKEGYYLVKRLKSYELALWNWYTSWKAKL